MHDNSMEFARLAKGPLNPGSIHKVYMSKTLSQEIMVFYAYFELWSLTNISLWSSAPVLLNN
jgi:hypothetical protein